MITPLQFALRSFRLFSMSWVLLLAGFSSHGHANYEYVTQFGSFGTALGDFDNPRGVVVNSQAKIIISESANNRIQLCTELGSCTGFGVFGTASGEFDRPRGVAVNSLDRIFVADRGNDRIESCSSSGSCTDFGGSGIAVGQFESPRGVAVDGAGKIYITDTDNNRVQICDDQGTVCSAFGSLGSATGQFNSPSGIAINSAGKVIIADRGNNRIQLCTIAGSCSAFGSFGSALGQFNDPSGIALDSRDRIIVVDRFNDRIQVCTEQGSCTAFGSFGTGDGQFNAPWGVAVDSQDRIIVTDLGNDRIQIFAEPVAPPVQITAFTATPSSFEEGQSSTMNWTVSNATSCTALGGTSDWQALSPDPVAGSAAISIATAGSYTFTLECTDGNTTDSTNIGVTVTQAPPSVSIDTFTASPATIREGQSTTLSWTVSHAKQCTALGGTSTWQTVVPDATGGTSKITINVPAAYTFTLQCSDDSTTVSANADVIVTAIPLLTEMNAGLNDAWFEPVTDGQGFFITVFPDLELVVLSWFTYDTERPQDGVTANLGEPGHRWLNASGVYSANQAVMQITIASGGVFDTQTEIGRVDDGTIILTFENCNKGTVEYDIPSIGRQGIVPIQRVSTDNVALCEALDEPAAIQQSSAGLKFDQGNTLSSDGQATMAAAPLLVNMNAGLNDAWFDPVTDGQGFFITVFPDLKLVVLSWFTYDTERPQDGVTANLGEPGHRWLNASGVYSTNQAVMQITIASGGVFDTQTEIGRVDDGTIILTFENCNKGTVEYDIPSIGRQGIVPIQRVSTDNVVLCEVLSE